MCHYCFFTVSSFRVLLITIIIALLIIHVIASNTIFYRTPVDIFTHLIQSWVILYSRKPANGCREALYRSRKCANSCRQGIYRSRKYANSCGQGIYRSRKYAYGCRLLFYCSRRFSYNCWPVFYPIIRLAVFCRPDSLPRLCSAGMAWLTFAFNLPSEAVNSPDG